MNRHEFISKMSNNEDDYLKFELVENKKSLRHDLHAFLLLDTLMPSTQGIISTARHKEFYLNIDIDELVKVITEEQIIELSRCGVSYDSEYGCLYMFT